MHVSISSSHNNLSKNINIIMSDYGLRLSSASSDSLMEESPPDRSGSFSTSSVNDFHHSASSFDAPAHQKGGATPVIPRRRVSSRGGGVHLPHQHRRPMGGTGLLPEDIPPPPPPPPPSGRLGGDTPRMPGRRGTKVLTGEKKLLELACASAEW